MSLVDFNNHIFKTVVLTISLGVFLIFGLLLANIGFHGFESASQLSFWTDLPSNAGRSGGIWPILCSTALIITVCLAVSFPLALGTAVYLVLAPPNFFSVTVSKSIDVLSGIPSIVFGLFGNAFFCQIMGMGFSIMSGGLTLGCMILPILVKTIEVHLRSVSFSYLEAGASLGISQFSILLKIMIPMSVSGIITGFAVGIGRALSETAALMYTSGYSYRVPGSLFDSGRSISLHILDLSMNVPGGEKSAYGSVLVLVCFIVLINFVFTRGLKLLWTKQGVC